MQHLRNTILIIFLFFLSSRIEATDIFSLKDLVLKEVELGMLNHRQISEKYEIELSVLHSWIHTYEDKEVPNHADYDITWKRSFPLVTETRIFYSLQEMAQGNATKLQVARKYGISIHMLERWIRSYNAGQFQFFIGTNRVGRGISGFSSIENALTDLLSKKLTPKQVSKKYGVRGEVLDEWKKCCADKLSPCVPVNQEFTITKQALQEIFIEHTDWKVVAQKYRIKETVLFSWMEDYLRGRFRFDLHEKSDRTEELQLEIVKRALEEVIDGKFSKFQIARKYGLNEMALIKWIDQYNRGELSFSLQTKKISKTRKRVDIDRDYYQKVESALKEILVLHMPRGKVAEKYYVTTTTVSRWVQNYYNGKYDFEIMLEKEPMRKKPDMRKQEHKRARMGSPTLQILKIRSLVE